MLEIIELHFSRLVVVLYVQGRADNSWGPRAIEDYGAPGLTDGHHARRQCRGGAAKISGFSHQKHVSFGHIRDSCKTKKKIFTFLHVPGFIEPGNPDIHE